jgi:hypothetical protein
MYQREPHFHQQHMCPTRAHRCPITTAALHTKAHDNPKPKNPAIQEVYVKKGGSAAIPDLGDKSCRHVGCDRWSRQTIAEFPGAIAGIFPVQRPSRASVLAWRRFQSEFSSRKATKFGQKSDPERKPETWPPNFLQGNSPQLNKRPTRKRSTQSEHAASPVIPCHAGNQCVCWNTPQTGPTHPECRVPENSRLASSGARHLASVRDAMWFAVPCTPGAFSEP